ncbi:alpha-amylase family glycosyl hydrolase [Thermaurantimonas aggregans]|uniref:alpha-amylase family glycosyl hydrolase n=1 Tax=Thermaurantimonas aggregans TaxID=2173829 RepID=UPI0023F34B99|nr:alpha-amylase family glycosyl hydrolase [Thermaurantimonas aggregans]MCX8147730.1 alpha-amylase family protein [Thermaurantimonas aggregans]
MKRIFSLLAGAMLWHGCTTSNESNEMSEISAVEQKPVVYQMMTRLFGNKVTTNKPWGTKEENGVGKFNDITTEALMELKALGATHLWYTGVPHHALVGDYTKYGISLDDPDVVKGRAGSPYAVKDYYNVNPDLAVDVTQRLQEFKALIDRTHSLGLKVIIDLVPNHVARRYNSISRPAGVKDLGEDDDVSVEFHVNNNFYYIPGKAFQVPEWRDGYRPLGGELHPLADGKFEEYPAKWTGNGSRSPRPDFYDWYETVKVNYGVAPDGTKHFPQLPADYRNKDYRAHFEFWKGKTVPDTWVKFRQIAEYWIDFGVDGFRYDMAEMVPVEFWSYMNSAIKMKKPDAFLLAEIYNPSIYRDYIYLGKMDYLYDKVEMYDTLRHIVEGRGNADHLPAIIERNADIHPKLLHFLENHDEQRIASPAFAGDPFKALPAMVVSATVDKGATMIYVGQEVGEQGAEDAGFGKPTRTSIFDYIGVPAHQRWMNGGKFDGGALTEREKELRNYYKTLLNIARSHPALRGDYIDLHLFNRAENPLEYHNKLFSYIRHKGLNRLLVVVNFSDKNSDFILKLSPEAVKRLQLAQGKFPGKDILGRNNGFTIEVRGQSGRVSVHLEPFQSAIIEF